MFPFAPFSPLQLIVFSHTIVKGAFTNMPLE